MWTPYILNSKRYLTLCLMLNLHSYGMRAWLYAELDEVLFVWQGSESLH